MLHYPYLTSTQSIKPYCSTFPPEFDYNLNHIYLNRGRTLDSGTTPCVLRRPMVAMCVERAKSRLTPSPLQLPTTDVDRYTIFMFGWCPNDSPIS